MRVSTSAAIRTVLIADDNEEVLRSFRNVVQRHAEVLLCTNRATALELARRHPVDLAIIDLVLGTDDGLEVIAELRLLRPDAHLVLISGYGSVEVAVQAMKGGADDVIQKPVTFGEIIARLDARTSHADSECVTPSLERAQYEHVHRVLADSGNNKSLAARRLRIPRSRLRRLAAKPAPEV